MSAVAFDTLKLARKLRDSAEMSQAQAEGVAEALAEAMSGAELATKGDLAPLATKVDLAELRAELVEVEHRLDAKIAGVKADLENRLAETKSDLLKWVFGALAAQTAFLSAIKFFGH